LKWRKQIISSEMTYCFSRLELFFKDKLTILLKYIIIHSKKGNKLSTKKVMLVFFLPIFLFFKSYLACIVLFMPMLCDSNKSVLNNLKFCVLHPVFFKQKNQLTPLWNRQSKNHFLPWHSFFSLCKIRAKNLSCLCGGLRGWFFA
jgi:hypothetical protein